MTHDRHILLSFKVSDPMKADLLTGVLSMLGCTGFEETEEGLNAFAEEGSLDMEGLDEKMRQLGVSYYGSTVENRNWNALWESSFEPVVIQGKVSVRASFHQPVAGEGIEIVITPRMSFGTGHHATTWLMLSELADMDLSGRDVLDFGSGTGILSIMAEKRGARSVDAVDNDPVCVANADENARENGCRRIRHIQAESLPADSTYDVILANINRNIILAEAGRMMAALRPGGSILLSGLLVEDGPAVGEAFSGGPGHPPATRERAGWIIVKFG